MFFTLQSNDNKPLITPKLDEADALAKQQEDTLIARYAVFGVCLIVLDSLTLCETDRIITLQNETEIF